MSSTPNEKRRRSLPGAFGLLPRLSFSRRPPASEAEELSESTVAYGVKSGDTLRREFDNRKNSLAKRTRK